MHERRKRRGDMEVCRAGQRGKRFVRGIAAQVRAEVDRMVRRRQEPEIGAVRVVDQQQHPVRMADCGDRRKVDHRPEIIRCRQIQRRRLFPLDRFRDCGGRGPCGKIGRCVAVKPRDVQIQQRGGGQKRFMQVAGDKQLWRFPAAPCMLHSKKEHRADAL